MIFQNIWVFLNFLKFNLKKFLFFQIPIFQIPELCKISKTEIFKMIWLSGLGLCLLSDSALIKSKNVALQLKTKKYAFVLICPFGLVVWLSVRGGQVPGSIPGTDPFFKSKGLMVLPTQRNGPQDLNFIKSPNMDRHHISDIKNFLRPAMRPPGRKVDRVLKKEDQKLAPKVSG